MSLNLKTLKSIYDAGKTGYSVYNAGKTAYDAVKRRSTDTKHRSKGEKKIKRRKKNESSVDGPKIIRQGARGSSRAVTAVRSKRKASSKKKIVRVSRSLREKIKKVCELPKIRGMYKCISYGIIQPPATVNTQRVIDGLTGDVITNPMFHAWEFLHRASVLWNNKGDTSVFGARYSQADMIGSTLQVPPAVNTPSGNVSLRAFTAKFTVIDSYEMYEMKNNSERTIKLEIYVCQAKKPMFLDAVGYDTAGGAVSASPTYYGRPGSDWNISLHSENRSGGNLSNMQFTQLHSKPNNVSEFNKHYSYEIQKVSLEPGQDYKLFVQGPKMLELDYSKFYANLGAGSESVFQSIQKFTKFLMIIVKQDLVIQGSGILSGIAGRYPSTVAGPEGGSPSVIAVERQSVCKLGMPDQTGAIVNGTNLAGRATATVQLSNRRDVYFQTTYTTPGAGNIWRVDEQSAKPEAI